LGKTLGRKVGNDQQIFVRMVATEEEAAATLGVRCVNDCAFQSTHPRWHRGSVFSFLQERLRREVCTPLTTGKAGVPPQSVIHFVWFWSILIESWLLAHRREVSYAKSWDLRPTLVGAQCLRVTRCLREVPRRTGKRPPVWRGPNRNSSHFLMTKLFP